MTRTPGSFLAGWMASTFGGLARTTGNVLVWNAARLVFQLGWAVLLARTLGAEGYGVFSGVAGLAIALSGLAGVGLGLRMYQDAATDPAVFETRWAQARLALAWSGGLLAAAFIAGSMAWGPLPGASVPLLLAVAVSELILAPVITLLAFGYAAHGRMVASAMVPALLSLARMLAACAFLLAPEGSGLATYALLHAIATAAAVALSAWRFRRHFPVRGASAAIDAKDVVTGLGFTSIWVSGTAFASLDKTAALHWGGAETAGTYTASYRFASLLALPVDALLMSALPRLFKAGVDRARGSAIIGRLFLASMGYGLCAGVMLWCLAPALPWILGPAFLGAVAATRVLAWFLPVFCLRSLGANILLAFHQKAWRFSAEITGLLLLLVLMSAWVPGGGAVAAAQALLAAEVFLLVAVWARVVPLIGCIPKASP